MPVFVNGEALDDAAIREETAVMRARLQEALEDKDPLAIEIQAREWAIENLIERVLLCQAALDDPEPLAPAAFERALSGCVSPPDERARAQIEIRLRIERLVNRLTGKISRPKNKEISDFYRNYRDTFYVPELVHCAHIIKNIDEATSEAEACKAITRAQQELQAGRAFEDVADELSDCPGRGGDLGFFPRGQMVPEFDAEVFKLKPGERSEIFRTVFGFHIAKLYEKSPERYRELKEVRSEIEELIVREKQEQALEKFVDNLRAKADIRK